MSYDAAGRMTRIAHPYGEFPVTYDYLDTGEVSRIREYGATSGIGVVASFGYDGLGRRTSEQRGNGTSTSYGYDTAGRLASMGHDFAGSGSDLSVTFGYNPASQIVSRSANNELYSFSGVTNQNLTDSHNGLNQVTQAGGIGVAHDARGNTTQIGATTYAYDSENRMIAGAGAELHYDALGRLHSVPWGIAGSDHLGDKLMVERAYGGLPSRHYVYETGETGPSIWYEGNPGSTDRRFLHKDERGSVIAVSDNAGNVTAINRYDDYGMPQGGGITGRFGYTGQQWVPEIAMWYYRARVYNPDTSRAGGRFMQEDPSGYRDGPNFYGYAGGDPINFSDPLGTARCANHHRCEDVHQAAREARSMAQAASASLKALAGALRGGATLSESQSALRAAFEQKFGSGSATASALSGAARIFDRIADRIGERGKGAQVLFSSERSLLARANHQNQTITLGPLSAPDKLYGSLRGVILHEGGHLVRLGDQPLPAGFPQGIGRPLNGVQTAYGRGAASWLGAHHPDIARKNNDNYGCFATPECGGPD